MLQFHFFTTTKGTWVHKYDRGPLKTQWLYKGEEIAPNFLQKADVQKLPYVGHIQRLTDSSLFKIDMILRHT